MSKLAPLRCAIMAAALVAAWQGRAAAQDPPVNASLVGSWDGYSGTYSDVWGEGNYAYLGNFGLGDGNTARVHVVDISDPAQPFLDETVMIPSPNEFASPQDVKTGDGLLFVALEGGGVDSSAIIDIRDPGNRAQVATVRIAGFTGIHNQFYDQGFLYMCDSATPRIGIIDLRNFDPDNPPAGPITQPRWMLENVGNSFVHDITVVDGRMYAAAWDAGLWVYDVSDVGNTPPVLLGTAPGNNTHSMWPTADGRFVVTGEERGDGGIKVFEIIEQGPGIALELRDMLVLSNDAYSVHNQVVIGNRLYNAWYQAGLQVFDIDCITGQLQFVASFDTSPANGSTIGFSGNWGVCPLLGEDRVLVSDMQTGFYVVDVDGPALTFCYPAGQPSLIDPEAGAELRVQVVGASAAPDLDTAQVWVQVDGGPFAPSPMMLDDGELTAVVGPAPCGSNVRYYISVDTVGGTPVTSPPNAPADAFQAVSATGFTAVQSFNFENAAGWSVSGTAAAGHWEAGVPAGDGTRGDPTEDFDGSGACFLTENVSGNSDVDSGFTQLLSPVLNLSNLQFPHIRYARWFSNDAGSAPEEDVFVVEISGGGTWMPLETVGPTGAEVHGGWFEVVHPVPAGVTPLNDVRVRFTAADQLNASVVEAGIDAFAVYDLVCPGDSDCATGTVEECCDLDSNGVRDDNCQWCACSSQTCSAIDIQFGDLGGSFGDCGPDGFVNLFDRTHALNCFAGTNPCPELNLDAGGAFGDCAPDGFCNLFDAAHTLTAFAGMNPCSCDSGGALAAHATGGRAGAGSAIPAPKPARAAPASAGSASITLAAGASRISPGDTVSVRVFITPEIEEFVLGGYQLHVDAGGGRSGRLVLEGLEVEHRPDQVFAGLGGVQQAFNVGRGQMLALPESGGAAVNAPAYLATCTFRASADAQGTFVIDLLRDSAAGDQTFLAADPMAPIDVARVAPAVVHVVPAASKGR